MHDRSDLLAAAVRLSFFTIAWNGAVGVAALAVSFVDGSLAVASFGLSALLLASCPRCHKPVRGQDLLVSGHCPNCSKALSSLLLPAPRAGLDGNEYLALMGALGVLVGLALASSGASAA